MSAVVELKHVTKNYGSNTALSNVSLEVPPGVVFALLGENGAGKTTAIRLMLGLTEPTHGEVRVLGLDSRRDGLAIRSRVGYLPERPTLYEWMTAAEIGWFTAGFYADGFEQQFRTLVAGFRVPLDRKLSQLSKGMRAKVALSLAMAHQPELLILDEPTSGLDTMVRREFLESMVDIAAEGRTVLLSSHQIGEVERVADFVAIVHGGRLLAVERLDQMKQSTRQLTVTVNDAAAPLAPIAGPNHPPAPPRPAMGRARPLARRRRPRTPALRRRHRRRRIANAIAGRNLRRLHGPITRTHHNRPPNRLRFSLTS